MGLGKIFGQALGGMLGKPLVPQPGAQPVNQQQAMQAFQQGVKDGQDFLRLQSKAQSMAQMVAQQQKYQAIKAINKQAAAMSQVAFSPQTSQTDLQKVWSQLGKSLEKDLSEISGPIEGMHGVQGEWTAEDDMPQEDPDALVWGIDAKGAGNKEDRWWEREKPVPETHEEIGQLKYYVPGGTGYHTIGGRTWRVSHTLREYIAAEDGEVVTMEEVAQKCGGNIPADVYALCRALDAIANTRGNQGLPSTVPDAFIDRITLPPTIPGGIIKIPSVKDPVAAEVNDKTPPDAIHNVLISGRSLPSTVKKWDSIQQLEVTEREADTAIIKVDPAFAAELGIAKPTGGSDYCRSCGKRNMRVNDVICDDCDSDRDDSNAD